MIILILCVGILVTLILKLRMEITFWTFLLFYNFWPWQFMLNIISYHELSFDQPVPITTARN